MQINCLACGLKVDLDEVYDDYEGQIRCYACKAFLEIRTEEGGLKSVSFANDPIADQNISELSP